jgi:tetratricopeptide (TPR) repeat protein
VLGNVMQAQGRFQEARTRHAEVVALVEKLSGPEAPELGEPLTALGEDLLGAGQPALAAPILERALALRDKGAEPGERAATAFALARAITAARGDRKRAIKLAERAADDAGRAPAGQRQAQERIQAWLARARRP